MWPEGRPRSPGNRPGRCPGAGAWTRERTPRGGRAPTCSSAPPPSPAARPAAGPPAPRPGSTSPPSLCLRSAGTRVFGQLGPRSRTLARSSRRLVTETFTRQAGRHCDHHLCRLFVKTAEPTQDAAGRSSETRRSVLPAVWGQRCPPGPCSSPARPQGPCSSHWGGGPGCQPTVHPAALCPVPPAGSCPEHSGLDTVSAVRGPDLTPSTSCAGGPPHTPAGAGKQRDTRDAPPERAAVPPTPPARLRPSHSAQAPRPRPQDPVPCLRSLSPLTGAR